MTKKKKTSKRNSSSDSEVDKEAEKSESDDEKPEAPQDRHFDEVQTRADIVKIMVTNATWRDTSQTFLVSHPYNS